MATPAPRKRPSGAPPVPRKGGKKRKKKSRKQSRLPQLIGGLTVLAIALGVGALVFYLVQRATPKSAALAPEAGRGSIKSQDPTWPGIVVHPIGEIYYPKATDMAKSPLETPVTELLGRKVITVFADGRFKPQQPIPRAEFVDWCYNTVMAQAVRSDDPLAVTKKPFTTSTADGLEFSDVPGDYWACDVLATIKASHIFDGVLTSTFRPDAPLTRGEWLVFASHFASSKDSQGALSEPLDASKLENAYHALGYTDFSSLQAPLRPYAWFIVGDANRKQWLGETFQPPINPANTAWNPNKALTRGEAASWIAAAYADMGTGSF